MFILLDIDGVMVTTPVWKTVELLEDGFSSFNPRAVRCLNHLLSETNASIILTSSHKSRFSNEEWIDLFSKRGIVVSNISKLDFNSSLGRMEEIIIWYNSNSDKEYIIIDDDTSLNGLPAQIKNHLVLTKPLIGLNEDAMQEALLIASKMNKHLIY